jgi:hypothetical protein
MVCTLYATFLYGSPDRKPALAPTGEPDVESRLPNLDEDADDTATALEKR